MTTQNLTVVKNVIKNCKVDPSFIAMARRPDINFVLLRKWTPVFLLILVLSPLQDVWAWGPMGHRIVSEIAETRLLPEVKTKIRENFNIKKLSDVANWADTVRKKRSQGPWHYCNIEESQWTYEKHRDCPDGDCVIEKLRGFASALKGEGLSKRKRKEALKYLIHFAGDVHQPLHLGNAQDRGGNKIRVTFKGRSTNLHTLWDGKLIDLAGKSLVQYARDLSLRVTSFESRKWNSSQVIDWANESRAVALNHAYVLDPSREGGLSKKYIETSREIIELRLSQAGVRLAGTLNRLFSPTQDTAPGKRNSP
jgi:nuclease S1